MKDNTLAAPQFPTLSPLSYQDHQLYFDEQRLQELNVKTPTYLYSKNVLTKAYQRFENAAKKHLKTKFTICYAMKANPNAQVVNHLQQMGSGADVVSGGELKRALECGVTTDKIVFSGVGKTHEELQYALSLPEQLLSLNVESVEELQELNEIAKEMKVKPNVSMRFNPRVKANTHRHVATGDGVHKFGILEEDIRLIWKNPQWNDHLNLNGLSVHIGSQIFETHAIHQAIEKLSQLAKDSPSPITHIDCGGGLGVHYHYQGSPEADLDAYFSEIQNTLNTHWSGTLPQLSFEPGRILVARSGILLTKVIRLKKMYDKTFVILDAGMNDFIRPVLYDAYHEIFPVLRRQTELKHYEVVGPVCETSDSFASERYLTVLEAGDLVVIADTGAYGASMGSTYNLRALTREVFL